MTLERDLVQLEADSQRPNPYKRHFLLKNPFPGDGEVAFDVCADQEELRKKFMSILLDFSSDAKRLYISGTNGAGKTNILKYFELLTNAARKRGHINNLHPVYIESPGENVFDVHGQIVGSLASLFLDVILERDIDSEFIESLQLADEFSLGIKALLVSSTISYLPQQERKKNIFVRWLQGWKLTVADKKELSYQGWSPTDIASVSLALRYLKDFLVILKALNLCEGVVLLLDEFEVIFQVLPRARQSRYAQDLRNLLDTLVESVYFVVATTPLPEDLEPYPAIKRRLGTAANLEPINSFDLALDFVSEYLKSGRDEYEDSQKSRGRETELSRPTEFEPLTEKIVREVFCSLKEELGEAELDVLPGRFLPRIREKTKEIVENTYQ